MICFECWCQSRPGVWELALSTLTEDLGTRTAPSTGGLLEMLTRKQYELLRFINERLKEAGVPPSFDEMKDALDLRSKSGIHRLITALEERGFIRRLPNRARAIEVIKLPELSPARRQQPPRLHAERHRRQARQGAAARRPPRTTASGRSPCP